MEVTGCQSDDIRVLKDRMFKLRLWIRMRWAVVVEEKEMCCAGHANLIHNNARGPSELHSCRDSCCYGRACLHPVNDSGESSMIARP